MLIVRLKEIYTTDSDLPNVVCVHKKWQFIENGERDFARK